MKAKLVWSMVAGLAGGLLTAGAAQAADIGVSAQLGTTGIGVHAVIPVQPKLNARVGVNAFNYSYDDSVDDVDYDFKFKLKTFDALLDWYPTDSSFRISSGLVYNGNKVDVAAKPTGAGTYTFNGRTYTVASAGQVDGRVDFRRLAPYLGIGWGNAVAKDKGWGFTMDLGVLFQGSPRTALSSSGCTADTLICSQLASDIAAENAQLRDEVKDFKAYPVLRAGVSYRF